MSDSFPIWLVRVPEEDSDDDGDFIHENRVLKARDAFDALSRSGLDLINNGIQIQHDAWACYDNEDLSGSEIQEPSPDSPWELYVFTDRTNLAGLSKNEVRNRTKTKLVVRLTSWKQAAEFINSNNSNNQSHPTSSPSVSLKADAADAALRVGATKTTQFVAKHLTKMVASKIPFPMVASIAEAALGSTLGQSAIGIGLGLLAPQAARYIGNDSVRNYAFRIAEHSRRGSMEKAMLFGIDEVLTPLVEHLKEQVGTLDPGVREIVTSEVKSILSTDTESSQLPASTEKIPVVQTTPSKKTPARRR